MTIQQKLVPQSNDFYEIYTSIHNINPNIYMFQRSIPEIKELIHKIIKDNEKSKEILPSEIIVFNNFKKMLDLVMRRNFPRNKETIDFIFKCREDIINAINDRINHIEEFILSENLIETEEETLFRKILSISQSFRLLIKIHEFNFKKYYKKNVKKLENYTKLSQQMDKSFEINKAFTNFIFIIYSILDGKMDETSLNKFMISGLKYIINREELIEFRDRIILPNAQL